jgi:hypothetical protein
MIIGNIPGAKLVLFADDTNLVIVGEDEFDHLKIINVKRELGHAVAWWLRHYATSWKVMGSRPLEVTGFYYFT